MKLANVPSELVLCRFEPPIVPGKHFQIRHGVDNIEKLRMDRMQAAVDKKVPKLAAWKRNEGAVLEIENRSLKVRRVSKVRLNPAATDAAKMIGPATNPGAPCRRGARS